MIVKIKEHKIMSSQLNIKINTNHANIIPEKWKGIQRKINKVHSDLLSQVNSNEVGLGWWDWPVQLQDTTIDEIKNFGQIFSKKLNLKYLVLIGVGGSSLGAWAGYQMLSRSNPDVELLLAGNNLSSHYMNKLLNKVRNHSYAVCVVSKSGGTLEPAVALRVFNKELHKKYGEAAAERLITITEDNGKALCSFSRVYNLKSFYIPKTIGGRFSVLTNVGLVPLAICGIDINSIIKGARSAFHNLATADIQINTAYKYAATRFLLYQNNYKLEILSSYEPEFYAAQQWWQQLFGESEGKDNKGLFPAVAAFTQDLHSLGQYIQSGPCGLFFETICDFRQGDESKIYLPSTKDNSENLNGLAGVELNILNNTAMESVINAHADYGTPQICIQLPVWSPASFGYYCYWMMRAATISAMLLGVNPFNQPGVEVYKSHLKILLSNLKT